VKHPRTTIAGLALSASAFLGLISSEGYTDKAVIPTKGDRPTVGFGSTFRDDGSPVQMGDTITPQRALKRTLAHIEKDEARLKGCVTAPLNQVEYNVLLKFSYQYGAATTCASSIVRHLNAGRYTESCNSYLDYRYMTSTRPIQGWEEYKPGRWRFDCSTPGNRACMGVWTRQLERQASCLSAQ
jgi:GH24 family phage-related lysozyme (muramidase)